MPLNLYSGSKQPLPAAYLLHFHDRSQISPPRRNPFPLATLGSASLFFEGHVYRLGSEKLAALTAEETARRLLESYLKEGVSVFTTVAGEFTVVVLERGAAVVYRSLTSPFQFYYDASHASNHLLHLLEPRAALNLDEDYLLHFLLRREGPFYQFEKTPLRGIQRLPAGHCLTIKPGNPPSVQAVEQRNFRAVTNYRQKPEDVVPELQVLMREVVDDRLDRFADRPLVSQLSGGLDSSYLCSLIGERTRDVSAFMYSYPTHASHRFSETCAQAVAEKYQLDFTILPPEVFFPFDLGNYLAYADEPSSFSWQGAVFGTRLRERIGDRAVIFCGSGSDQLFYRQTNVLPWLLKRGKFHRYFKTLVDCGRVIQRSPANLFYQSLLSLIPGPLYSPLISFFEKLPFNPISTEDINKEFNLLDVVPWINPEKTGNVARLQRRILAEEQKEHEANFGQDSELRSPLCALADPQMSIVPFVGKGVDYQMPFSDTRLLEFVFQKVSWHLIYDWKSPYKHLLREAQKGTVPEITRTRPKNEFDFSGFLRQLLTQNERCLHGLLSENEWSGSGLFDEKQLPLELEKLLFGFNNNSSRSLLSLASYLLWLRDFKESRKLASIHRETDTQLSECRALA